MSESAGPSPEPTPPTGPPRKSIMRSLGEFVGHIAHAVRTPAAPADGSPSPSEADAAGRQVTRQTVEEETRDTPAGPVKLRRTIIEEVELPPPSSRLKDEPESDRP